VEHSMEESFPRPWPDTTPPPPQQLPNSKCSNTSSTNLQASEASNNTASNGTARVSQACGCLNNDIRQTIPPRSNSPSLTHFRSSTQRRLLTLSRPWHIGRHLRRPQQPPLPFHVLFQTPQILCSGTSHTVQYKHVHSQAHQPLETDGNSTASDRSRLAGNR